MKWEVAKEWEASLIRTGAVRLSSVAGVRGIQALRALEDQILPVCSQ